MWSYTLHILVQEDGIANREPIDHCDIDNNVVVKFYCQ